MSTVVKRTVSLSNEQAVFVDNLIESGDYTSVSEVVRAGIRAMQAQNQALDRWLYEEVVPVYDEMQAHPERAVTAKRVFDRVHDHHRRVLADK